MSAGSSGAMGANGSTAPPGVRVALTLTEAAQSLGVSEASFRRHVLPDLRVVQLGPRLTVVRVTELDRFLQRREALSNEA
jgi:hypothetical protein